MKVTCNTCQKVINVPDEKLPEGKPVTFPCPSCKEKITVTRTGDDNVPHIPGVPETTPHGSPLDETQNIQIPGGAPTTAADLAKMLDSVESEMDILGEATLRALVADPEEIDRITPVLRKLGYAVTTVKSAEEAQRKMKFNFYSLVVINEKFGGGDLASNPLLAHIAPMIMEQRRKMFVVLLGRNFKTLDNMTAFLNSVNMVMNVDDFSNFELILRKAMKENDAFYAVFKKMMVESGKELEAW
ncbi:MAG: hypothetical protein HQK87_02530 [Nitrospinae bacterium]|nr:hypothetical protein [Nitrospinota bacterium]